MEIGWVRVCAWRLLVGGGNSPDDIARLAGVPVSLVEEVVDGRRYGELPGTIVDGVAVEPRCHRARLELRRGLDLLDRRGGPTACWRSRGWRTADGRAGRRSSLLGTTSLARQVLMVTSETLAPDPALVAAHRCHDGLCANPRCLVGFVSRAENAAHRRLARLQIAIPPRADADIRHLDVTERRLGALTFLAVLERYVRELVPVVGRDGDHCLVRAGTQGHDYYTTVHLPARGGVVLHRLMLEAAGVHLSERLALHGPCDFPPCVRLAHLRAGTAKENSNDARVRGRLAVGERHGRAIYTNPQVADMRRRFFGNQAEVSMLQQEYGGDPVTLLRALRAQSYTGAGGPAVELPIRRRLSDCGVKLVRALVAVGVCDRETAEMVGLSHVYVRDVAAGLRRAEAGGVLTARPGPARGRTVGTARLCSYDKRYIIKQLQADVPKRQIARELGIDARTVDRVSQAALPAAGR